MAIGRKTGGRQKGTPNKATAAQAAEVAASGDTPLTHMLNVMRDPNESKERRLEAAKSAAPYVHPKLMAQAINVDLSDDEADPVTRVVKTAAELIPMIRGREPAAPAPHDGSTEPHEEGEI